MLERVCCVDRQRCLVARQTGAKQRSAAGHPRRRESGRTQRLRQLPGEADATWVSHPELRRRCRRGRTARLATDIGVQEIDRPERRHRRSGGPAVHVVAIALDADQDRGRPARTGRPFPGPARPSGSNQGSISKRSSGRGVSQARHRPCRPTKCHAIELESPDATSRRSYARRNGV